MIDWPTVFTGFKTILDPLADASWPISVAFVALLFRGRIGDLIGRIKEASGFGTSVAFSQQALIAHQQDGEQQPGRSVVIDPIRMPLPDPVYDNLDKAMLDAIDATVMGNDRLKLNWAVRQRSIAEASRIHEANYRLMFGSQIRAIDVLNEQNRSELAHLSAFYEQVASDPQNEVIHKGRSFDMWYQYLLLTRYIEQVSDAEPAVVQITAFGRQFCTWMSSVGAFKNKAG